MRNLFIILFLFVALGCSRKTVTERTLTTNTTIANRDSLLTLPTAVLDRALAPVDGTETTIKQQGYTIKRRVTPVKNSSGVVVPNVVAVDETIIPDPVKIQIPTTTKTIVDKTNTVITKKFVPAWAWIVLALIIVGVVLRFVLK